VSGHSLFDLVVAGAGRVSPDKTAVISDGAAMTYAELLSGARGIAAALREAGIGRGDRVGIWMDKTPRCVQALLGALAAGAAYVPLDSRAPWRRCQVIAQDCGFAALAVDSPRLGMLRDLLQENKPRLLLLDAGETDAKSAAGAAGVRNFEVLERSASRTSSGLPSPGPSDTAYILYTSGSTGTPKGVVHTHDSGLAFTTWVQERFEIRPDDVFSSHAPFHFDLSISDLFASLGLGASVRLISSSEGMLPPYLVRKISEWGITVWYSVPSILVGMLDAGQLEERGLRGVRLLLFAGEVFPTPQLRRLRRALPDVALFNLFGPTETNVCTYYEVPPDIPDERTAPIPIGRACEHMETFVLDEQGREVGAGTAGTLWVKGRNLMKGYWGDPDMTLKLLQADPRGMAGLAYCTGDQVRLQSDGNYEFLGRRDHMVKTRGYRVELGEIESALGAHPEVLEAVAVPLPDPQIGNRIVATVVPRAGCAPEVGAMLGFCKERLPLYMIPERIEIRRELPRTSTGKADRGTLRIQWERGEHS
jgi:amino acid adenylation domain-containing protein